MNKFQFKSKNSGYVFAPDKSNAASESGESIRKGSDKKTAEGQRKTQEDNREIKMAFKKY